MREQEFCSARVGVSQTSAQATPAAAKGLDAIWWTRDADENLRNLKRVA
jgi:hypothetical protein